MSKFPISPKCRAAKAPTAILAAIALVLVAGLGVWYFTKSTAPKTIAFEDLPKGRVISVEPIKGYEPNLTKEDSEALRKLPDDKDKQALKRYLIAKAKLEPDPMARTRLLQEAIVMTDGYGTTPPITADNPQVRSAFEALKQGANHPERLSPFIAPKPFDAVAYKANPQAYLDVAEPGRVFQSKPFAPGVAAIQPVSPYFQDVKQGESIELAVKVAPGAPVTFTSFDCGSFDNGLTTRTVAADAAGVARVKFLGMPGTVLETNILAASPMTSGQVRFKTNTLVYADGKQIASK